MRSSANKWQVGEETKHAHVLLKTQTYVLIAGAHTLCTTGLHRGSRPTPQADFDTEGYQMHTAEADKTNMPHSHTFIGSRARERGDPYPDLKNGLEISIFSCYISHYHITELRGWFAYKRQMKSTPCRWTMLGGRVKSGRVNTLCVEATALTLSYICWGDYGGEISRLGFYEFFIKNRALFLE